MAQLLLNNARIAANGTLASRKVLELMPHPVQPGRIHMTTMQRDNRFSKASRAGFAAVLLATTMFLASFAAPVQAALVTYTFQGAVGDVSDPLFPTFNTGQTLSGSFTFNSLANQFGPGAYPNALTDIQLNLGGAHGALTTGTNLIRIINAPGAGPDFFRLRGSINMTTPLGTFANSVFRIDLRDPTGAAFNSVSLPSSGHLSVSSFASNKWQLILAGGRVISGSLTSLQAVPLPSTLVLFGAGLIALVAFGSGGLRNIRKVTM